MAAVVSGLLLTAAFPNLDLNGFAWFALVPLVLAVEGLAAGSAFRLGFLAGLVHYLTLMYWLVPTMTSYGHLPLWLAVPVLFLLTSYLALYPAAFAWALRRVDPDALALFVFMPIVWTALEYVRTHFLTGLPWELLGCSQYRQLHLIQISDMVGVYGVSFLIVMVNALLVLLWRHFGTGRAHNGGRSLIAAGLVTLLLISATWQYGRWRMDTERAGSDTAVVTVVQGNIPQDIKWEPQYQAETINKYIRISQRPTPSETDLIVWPETATPFYFLYNRPLSNQVLAAVKARGVDFLIGSPSFDTRQGQIVYFNSAYLIRADGQVQAKYDKSHLVPFGEYVPFKRWLPFLGKMVAQVGDFRPGPRGESLQWRDRKLGILICYELIFPHLARAQVRNGANLLLNLTNDAWYGRTSAPYQHFSLAVFRAVENRRALVRSANTGISGFIDPTGRIGDTSGLFEESSLTARIPINSQLSCYTRYGDVFAGVCLGIAALWIVVAGRLFPTRGRPRPKK